MAKFDRRAWGLAMGSVLLAAAGTARAEFPEKPVTLVVPFAAGGPSDKIARDLAEALRKRLNQTVIVENVGGAGGTIGTARVAAAPADSLANRRNAEPDQSNGDCAGDGCGKDAQHGGAPRIRRQRIHRPWQRKGRQEAIPG